MFRKAIGWITTFLIIAVFFLAWYLLLTYSSALITWVAIIVGIAIIITTRHILEKK